MSYDRNAAQARRRQARAERGQCIMEACPNAPAPERRLCQKHLDANREAVHRYRGQERKEQPVLANLLAIAAAMTRPRTPRTTEELEALRKQCASAEILELGDLLFRARTAEEVQIITAEVRRRGFPC